MSFPEQVESGSALREPGFRYYFIAACQSTLGTWITRFMLGWSAWELTHSALWVGIVSTCLLFPAIILSPLFGVLSDRVSPRNGMLCTTSAQGVVAAVAFAVLAGGMFSLGWLLVLALAIGAISAAHQPLRLALVPRLVSRGNLPSAIGLSAIVFNLSRIFGPAVAGAVISQTSAAITFLLAALLFAGAFLSLLGVRNIGRPADIENKGVLLQLLEGVRFAMGDPAIRIILVLSLINGLLGRTVIELLPAISGKLLSGTASTLAILTAAAGVGSILGGLLLARQRDSELKMARFVLVSLILSAAVLFPVTFASTIWVMVPIVAVLSMGTTMAGIGSQALAQLVVEEEFRGRVMSFWITLSMGAPAVGSFVIGGLADLIGFVPTLTGLGVTTLIVVSLLYRRGLRTAAGSAQ